MRGVFLNGKPIGEFEPPDGEKRTGKLLSEAVRDRALELAAKRGRNWSRPDIDGGHEDRFDALLDVLDERLGRSP